MANSVITPFYSFIRRSGCVPAHHLPPNTVLERENTVKDCVCLPHQSSKPFSDSPLSVHAQARGFLDFNSARNGTYKCRCYLVMSFPTVTKRGIRQRIAEGRMKMASTETYFCEATSRAALKYQKHRCISIRCRRVSLERRRHFVVNALHIFVGLPLPTHLYKCAGDDGVARESFPAIRNQGSLLQTSGTARVLAQTYTLVYIYPTSAIRRTTAFVK